MAATCQERRCDYSRCNRNCADVSETSPRLVGGIMETSPRLSDTLLPSVSETSWTCRPGESFSNF